MTTRRRGWLLLVGGMLIVGCAGGSTPSSLDGAGSESSRVAGVWWLAFGLGAAVYAIVAGLVVFGALRNGSAEVDAPRRQRERVVIAVGGVLIPFFILLFLAGVTVNATAHLRKAAPSNSVQIEVTGKRWWWQVRYPALGIDTANEIHIPVGQPVHFTLKSDNVIHSFWVPQLAGKEDMIPGQTNELTFTANRPGKYRGLCAEYCGTEHAKMLLFVIAQPASDFTTWVAHEKALLTGPTSEETAAGQQVFEREACAGCHTIRGTSATGTIGPNLSDVGSRSTIAAGWLENTPENLASWIDDAQKIKPGSLMPPIALSDRDLSAIVAYLESLK
ncbi:MAG TPA: cytochrome c oxidase subunit II [Acidimicrobiia bacterium]|nr:cytochrome c oxidase subunit II [Acidimicrobiia bacterium]